MIAADRHAVTVTGDDPHVEIGVGQLDASRKRRRTAMDGVETIALDVIREAAGAADPAHEYRVGRVGTQFGQRALDGLEDRVVTAARAPAHFLIGFPVLERGLDLGDGGHVVHRLSLKPELHRSRLRFPRW